MGVAVAPLPLALSWIPPEWRDRLIHLRWHHPLPGCRAFSEVGPRSSHVDMAALIARIGTPPTDSAAQNQLFYRLYKPLRDDIGVCDAHRRYLAARDVGTISALLVILLPMMALLATHDIARTGAYAAPILLSYILCALAAKNYSCRMVQHVMALAAADHIAAPAAPTP
jgi:hypothetical protein